MHDLARCVLSAGERVLDGYVVAFIDGTMTIGAEDGALAGFRDGDDVEVLVLDPVRGEVHYSGWLVRVGPTTVQVGELELTAVLQKRQAARVNITQICTGVVGAADDDAEPITFMVLDIGAHGMRIATTAALTESDRVRFGFPTGARTIALDAEVVRSQPTHSGSTQYGCRFVGLRESDSDALFRYVLHAQGAQRRTRLMS